jgi:hypothetical protein
MNTPLPTAFTETKTSFFYGFFFYYGQACGGV